MTTRTMLCTGRTGHFTAKLQYTIMEIQPGLEVMIVTGEDVAQLAEAWAAHLDEVERRPNMADEPPTCRLCCSPVEYGEFCDVCLRNLPAYIARIQADEAAQLDEWANGDPHLARWMSYNVQPAERRDDWIGD